MKKLPFSLIILLVMAISCKTKPDKKNLFVGKWQKYNEEPDFDYADSTCVIEFNANGWYTTNCSFGNKGNYIVKDNKIDFDVFFSSPLDIIILNEHELVLRQNTPRSFDPIEYYKRIQ